MQQAASPEPLDSSSCRRRQETRTQRGFWEAAERCIKRPCTADPGRAGSVESECTNFGAGTEAAADATNGAWGDGSFISTAEGQMLLLSSRQPSTQSHHSLASLPAASSCTTSQPAAAAALATAGAVAAGAVEQAVVAQHGTDAAAVGAGCASDPAELVAKVYRADLAAANETLKRLPLPGSQHFWPVHHTCAMLPLCAAYEVPPTAVALGASYFQRLLAGSQELRNEAMRSGFFSLQQQPGATAGCQEWVMHSQPGCPRLNPLLCTCIYLGAKMTERPRYERLLSSMLGHVLRCEVPTKEAAEMELRCLEKLSWRLGPYRCANSLP